MSHGEFGIESFGLWPFGAGDSTQAISATGFEVSTVFGAPALNPGMATIAASSFSTVIAMGGAVIDPGGVNVAATSFAIATAFGVVLMSYDQIIELTGFQVGTVFGALVVDGGVIFEDQYGRIVHVVLLPGAWSGTVGYDRLR